ncbi:HRSL1 enzyme, partial [Grantiella picta]|nr:HRSL1 enzyme [Grantiella picta]
EMNICWIAHGSCHPKPGDLIEIKWGLYQHWALYMGDGYVIHVTAVDENAQALPASTATLSTGKVKVKKELLTKVVGNDEWTVNNKYDWYCSPLPMEEIIRHAEGYIDKEVPYDLIRNSSEAFVENLRYGDQVSD